MSAESKAGKFFTFIQKHWIGIIIAAIFLIILIWLLRKYVFKDKTYKDKGTLEDWAPTQAVAKLRGAFDYFWGTDEAAIWEALGGLNSEQVLAVYNAYNTAYGENLIERGQDELSGDDLTRFMDYFTGISAI